MDELDEFIKTSKARIQAILNRLQWNEDDVFRDYNTNSLATAKETKSEMMGAEIEPTLPPSCAHLDSVVLAEREMQQLLNNPNAKAPRTFSDLQVNFNREEKLVLYEHTVKQRKPVKPLTTVDHELVSLADIVAMKKREKTKRRKYRIKKPTQTEEVRSLIELQMQALKQYLETKSKAKTNEKEYKRERENLDYARKRSQDNRCYKNPEEKASTSKTKSHRSEKLNVEHGSKRSRYSQYSEGSSYKEKRKSRSRSPSKYSNRRRSRSRSRSRHKSRHRSRKRKKEKHKKIHKRGRS